ncbi:MAG: DMT family transporter [Alphaproteobacteria bacterium]|nr:DMT family transporter [Alphaproteobacteria bacterium]
MQINNKSWILIIILGIVWGSSFYFVEVLLQFLNPFMIVFLRVSIASIALIGFCVIKKIQFRLNRQTILLICMMGFINNAIPFSLITYGQQSTTGGLAAILNSTTAFFGIMLTPLFYREEKITWNRLLGVLVGFMGVAIIIGIDNLRQFDTEGAGKYLIIGASVSYAFASMLGKRLTQTMPPIMSATAMLTASSLILLCYIVVTGQTQFSLITPYIFAYAVAFALICSVLAYLIYFETLRHTGASNLTLCTIILPASAILLDAAFLGQFITRIEFYGMLVIMVGLITLDGRIFKLLRN